METIKSTSKFATIGCVLALVLSASVGTTLKMRCHAVVPKEYEKTSFNPPPNGEPEPIRYRDAYEAFWWNCVAVRATNLGARCPTMASGTPAASAGAADGGANADSQIEELLKKHAATEVQKYLRLIASTSEAKEKMRPYFNEPKAEPTD